MKPDYVDQVLEEAASLDLEIRGPEGVSDSRFRPLCIAVVRDEYEAMPGFLDHYRNRGVREFVILDNNSRDGTADYLDEQVDVLRYPVDRPFSWIAKQGWITHVIERIGYHRWYLVADADERVVFVDDEHYGFEELVMAMAAQRIRRVRGLLVDMYGAGPALGSGDVEQILFDGDGFDEKVTHRMVSVKGGPRKRVLSSSEYRLDPELTKYPLFRLKPGEVMANPHHIWPYEGNWDSPCHLGILHYKYGAELARKVERAISEGNYWNDSFEYRAYREAFRHNPELSLEYGGSRIYRSPEDLVDCGLVKPVDWKKNRMKGHLLRLFAR